MIVPLKEVSVSKKEAGVGETTVLAEVPSSVPSMSVKSWLPIAPILGRIETIPFSGLHGCCTHAHRHTCMHVLFKGIQIYE